MIECLLTNILLLSVVTMASSWGAARAYEIAKPGCADECGGVKIPFPFGIGDGCYRSRNSTTDLSYNDAFKIKCDNSTNPPIPFFVSNATRWEVLSISLEDWSIRISVGVTYKCYNNSQLIASSTPNDIYSMTGLYLITYKNKFVAVGCDTWAVISDGEVKSECNTSCIYMDGCCETSLLGHYMFNFNSSVQVGSLSRHKQGCNYAFVSEVGWHNFSAADLTKTAADCAKIRVPVVYYWRLSVSKDYVICGLNTHNRSYSTNCQCWEGYTGNPYLPQGCQDINECEDKRLHDCQKQEFCVNNNGGYVCQCPDGHHGNGTIASPCLVVDGVGSQAAKPGCQAECNGVKIPFPFGIGDGCFAQTTGMWEFEIECDPTNPKPVIPYLGNREVLSINIEDHTLRISSGVAYQCYKRGQPLPSATNTSRYALLDTSSFSISTTRNKFVAIGCVATARLRDDDDVLGFGLNDESLCRTSCTNVKSARLHDGKCYPAFGCCETSDFTSIHSPSIYVESLPSDINNDNDSCIYAFVGEVDSYKFSASNLTRTPNELDNIRVPVVHDWHVYLENNCSEAKKKDDVSYNLRTLCRSNTMIECIDEDEKGYHCQCLEGYNGNPYLPHGCQDINECLSSRLNHCQRPEYCENKDGGYNCKCPKGYYGNGTTTSPCIPSPRADHTLILGLSIGMCSLIGMILFYGLFKLLKRRKDVKDRKHNFKKNGGLLLQQEMSTNEGAIERTKIFNRSELEKATDNFNNSRVLGCGGQGTVYKGMLSDGTIVAVKKSKRVDEHLLAQFINEVVVLSQINHRNVVKLFGCCLETEVPLLVYEFVPNGTLYQHIHHPIEDFQMTWKVRFQIAVECAGAVAYLHSSCSSPIYHRDIKSSNILLDEKYKAKISDFGTSRSISIDKTHVTTCVQGTFGYLDPEFFRSSHFNEKSDVYSFGVVLLELLTSKKPIFIDMSTEPRSLATEFVHLMETSPNQLHDFLDNQVLQECSEEEIEALAKLIERCLSLSGKQRPTMREVAMTLEMIKSQHGREENPGNDQEITRQLEGHVLNDNAGITTEYPSIDTSSYTDSSYSTNLQSFDCN